MTLDDLRYLATPKGRELLRVASENHEEELSLLSKLRKNFKPLHCRTAVNLWALRKQANLKFTLADGMVFDREGLEQSSGEKISFYRARRYKGQNRVVDLCCGIGGDTIALAQQGEVVSLDLNPVRVGMTRWNAEVYNSGNRVRSVCSNLLSWIPETDAIFMDPSRRKLGRRFLRPRDYFPPIQTKRLFAITPNVGIKVAPGIPHEDIPPNCETEFISEHGTCKEAVFWFGNLKTASARRATLLPSEATMTERSSSTAIIRPPGRYLYEPDNAVIRAHLIDQIAEDLGAWKLDPQVAYLSSDCRIETYFARCYQVVEIFPFSLKRLQNYLTAKNIGRLDIKKRRFPISSDEMRQRLKLHGEGWAIVFLTRISERPVAVICCPEEKS